MEIRAVRITPFDTGPDQIGLVCPFDAGLVALLKAQNHALRSTVADRQNVIGWLPRQQVWFCDQRAWPRLVRALMAAGHHLVEPDPVNVGYLDGDPPIPGLHDPEPGRLPRVYFAGKIAKGDWRTAVAPDLRSLMPNCRGVGEPVAAFPDGLLACDGRLIYTGPFFVGDDHGCGHGDGSHGLGAHGPACFTGATRAEVVRLCRHWLERSDLVFAWVDTDDCFGTVAEIGYAVALGKPVYLYGPRSARTALRQEQDMWFMRTLVGGATIMPTVRDALDDFCRRLTGSGYEMPSERWTS